MPNNPDVSGPDMRPRDVIGVPCKLTGAGGTVAGGVYLNVLLADSNGADRPLTFIISKRAARSLLDVLPLILKGLGGESN